MGRAIAQTDENRLGPIDVWVNNAMATVFAPFAEITPAEYQRVTDVTYLGSVYGTMAALRRMRPRDHGAIVQVGSALAYQGIPLQSAYCGANALLGYVQSLRAELPRHLQPVPPIYQPEVAADAIVWAAEHRRRQVFVGDSTVATIVGSRVAPGLMERYLARTGYGSQQTEEPVGPGRPDNLFEPLPGDAGAHGIFEEQARRRSLQLAATSTGGCSAWSAPRRGRWARPSRSAAHDDQGMDKG